MRWRRKRRGKTEPPGWDGLLPAFIDGKPMLVPPEVLEPYYRQVMARHDGGDLAERFAASQFGSNWRSQMAPQVRTDPTFAEWRQIAEEGDMAKITAERRRELPKRDFALPGKGKGPEGKGSGSYPIDTKARARSALSRGAANASRAEDAKIKRAVARKYPGIKQKGAR